jgi:hypothetical protein
VLGLAEWLVLSNLLNHLQDHINESRYPYQKRNEGIHLIEAN